MSTCYLVSHGQYSDYWVYAAFTTESKAQAWIDKFGRRMASDSCWDNTEIEEYDLNPEGYPGDE